MGLSQNPAPASPDNIQADFNSLSARAIQVVQALAGSAVWGAITGTLGAQADLVAALAAKFDNSKILRAYQAANLDFVNNTFANTDLTVTVEAGGIYAVHIQSMIDNGAGFFKNDFNGGTATITAMRLFGIASPAAESSQTPFQSIPFVALNTASFYGTGVEVKSLVFDGAVEFNAAGTFRLRGAQLFTDADVSTLFRGSSMILTKLN